MLQRRYLWQRVRLQLIHVLEILGGLQIVVQTIKQLQGTDLKREQLQIDLHHLHMLTSLHAMRQSQAGESQTSLATTSQASLEAMMDDAMEAASGLSLQGLFRDVNRAVSRQVLSVAEKMHFLRAPATNMEEATPHEHPTTESDHSEGSDGSPKLGRRRSQPRAIVTAVQESALPYKADKWFTDRAQVRNKPDRDAWLASLVESPRLSVEAAQLAHDAYVAAGAGHVLHIARSGLSGAGDGLWLKGRVLAGGVVALHPGVVYPPAYHTEMAGFPQIDDDNDRIMARYDNLLVDAYSWGEGQHVAQSPWPEARQSLDYALLLLEGWHPLALAHYANHPPKGQKPSMMVAPFEIELNSGQTHLRPYLPYVSCAAQRNDILSCQVPGIAFVATQDLEDQELFFDYRLNPFLMRPNWYTPVDALAEERRWAFK